MPPRSSRNSVRIIGGQWRGRRLPVLDVPGLRPSGDRCRETLFNWLQAYLPGAACADLFAGTGVLGLEAASRGAEVVTLVEKNSAVVSGLDLSINHLGAAQVHVVQRDALLWLEASVPDSLDIVFVDPPFDQGLTPRALDALASAGCVRPGGFVYFETEAGADPVAAVAGWCSWREKTIGAVRMQLFRRDTAEPSSGG